MATEQPSQRLGGTERDRTLDSLPVFNTIKIPTLISGTVRNYKPE